MHFEILYCQTHPIVNKSLFFLSKNRLFWPKSKSFDYLYSDGVALLRNFPIQATISFYEESDCEDDDEYEEDWEEDGNSEVCLKQLSHSTHYN